MVILGCWTIEFEGHGQHLRLYEVINEVPLTSQLAIVEIFGFESEPHHIILEMLRLVPIAIMLRNHWGNALALKQAQLITMHN